MENKNKETESQENYENLQEAFASDVRTALKDNDGEITERNQHIQVRDQYIYGDAIENALDIPIGHDRTPVNWLRRTVEIHSNQFMGRGFGIISTYDAVDSSSVDEDEEKVRIDVENKKKREFADLRRQTINNIIKDNGGMALFTDLAENASAVGDSIVKCYFDEKEKKYVISPVEAVENFRVVWSDNNFRKPEMYAYTYQISAHRAASRYGLKPEDMQLSPAGQPLEEISAYAVSDNPGTAQGMVTVIEGTGIVNGYGTEKGKIKRVPVGTENEFNFVIVGKKVKRIIDQKKKLPRYYILPNKRVRRRPWGVSDVSDSAINLNLTFIETLSDWRTVGSNVNFPKWKAFNFPPLAQLPTPERRKTQMLPLGEGQDLQLLNQTDGGTVDFEKQIEKVKEEYLKEVAISRVYFDDPSITLNSNQALMTSMKPTTDVAERKKAIWGPILTDIFNDALEVIAEYMDEYKDIVKEDEGWELKVQWPSVMPTDDPIYQSNLLNRWNGGTISIQSYLEKLGESKEEIDRMRDELREPVTAAILSKQIPLLASQLISPPATGPKVNVSLRGDLTPYQEANLASQQGFNEGPFPATAGPQGEQGRIAQSNADNQGFLEGDPFNGGTPIQQDKSGSPITTPAQNGEGQQPVSQPGSGATPVTPEGAVNQVAQQGGA